MADTVKQRLQKMKASRPAEIRLPDTEMARQLNQSLDVLNSLLNGAGRSWTVEALRGTLRERAAAKSVK